MSGIDILTNGGCTLKMERKLASIQTINNIRPIEGADKIERASVFGWETVIKKGEFKEGDKCVFFEIDSILPSQCDWTNFMSARKFRVKTVKIKGQLSQGLALPVLNVFDNDSFDVGEDVTTRLGITKYKPPLLSLAQQKECAGVFPSEIPKTDEIRIQSAPKLLEEIENVPLVATVKLDGMSGTFYKKDGTLHVCSRNWELKEGINAYWRVAKKYNLINILPEGIAVQGEVCGPGIQKNRLNLKEEDLFVFNVYDISIRHFLDNEDARKWCNERCLVSVPVAYMWEQGKETFSLDELLNLAEGIYEGTKNKREGIVIRPLKERYSSMLRGRLSFKVISNSFLLKEED